ncbi:DUF2190 family protein [Candidatus Pacearchaeota archaeon]|nr:DUF2190 family protein [Candidatus Pacearchaeota archaeon]
MALKPDRKYTEGTEIDAFMNVVAERGIIVHYSTSGSGTNMDDATNVVAIPTGQAPSGLNVAGLLLNDVVNKDLTQTHLNQHKDEVQLGGKVNILVDGWVVTDQVATGVTFAAGEEAYFDSVGKLTNADPGSADVIGRFMGAKGADGYVKVRISL